METIGLIVPCYNEEPSINIFYDEVERVFAEMKKNNLNYNHEYWFINDGSSDNTLSLIKDLRSKNENVHYISFSRNFGKESAMAAGLNNVGGDYVAVMDVDLQDPPALLPKMIKYIKEDGYDVVGCTQKTRKQGPIRAFLSTTFYKVINKVSEVEIKQNVRDYRLMTRQYVDNVLKLCEYNRFSKGIFPWVGFNTKYIEYDSVARAAGETHWSLYQLLEYAVEGFVDFSDAPLKVATWVGGLSFLISIIGLIFVVLRALFFGGAVSGWPSLVSIILLINGVQLLCLGIIGDYIGKIYLETKNRPKYIVKEKE